VWGFMEPVIREHLIQKHVPIDPLVYKITAFYWLMQELVCNWKAGRRLTLDQKTHLLQILVWNLSRVQQEHDVAVRRHGFDYPRETVDEEDINISQETTEQIAQLVLACKDFHLKD